jgi:hypothetical protein
MLVGGTKMYKEKRNCLNLILLLVLIAIFVVILLFIIHSESICYDKKIELIIQVVSMFITSLALILTFGSLKNEQKQKHISVRPYLILEGLDFVEEKINNSNNKQLDFDFSISNKGVGIANRIKVLIKKENNKEIIFSKEYVRLGITDDNMSYMLASIRDELNYMNRKNGNTISYAPYFGVALTDEFYIENYKDLEEYRYLIIEVIYYDIYGKKFKGTFNVVLNNEDYDLEDGEINELLEEWN